MPFKSHFTQGTTNERKKAANSFLTSSKPTDMNDDDYTLNLLLAYIILGDKTTALDSSEQDQPSILALSDTQLKIGLKDGNLALYKASDNFDFKLNYDNDGAAEFILTVANAINSSKMTKSDKLTALLQDCQKYPDIVSENIIDDNDDNISTTSALNNNANNFGSNSITTDPDDDFSVASIAKLSKKDFNSVLNFLSKSNDLDCKSLGKLLEQYSHEDIEGIQYSNIKGVEGVIVGEYRIANNNHGAVSLYDDDNTKYDLHGSIGYLLDEIFITKNNKEVACDDKIKAFNQFYSQQKNILPTNITVNQVSNSSNANELDQKTISDVLEVIAVNGNNLKNNSQLHLSSSYPAINSQLNNKNEDIPYDDIDAYVQPTSTSLAPNPKAQLLHEFVQSLNNLSSTEATTIVNHLQNINIDALDIWKDNSNNIGIAITDGKDNENILWAYKDGTIQYFDANNNGISLPTAVSSICAALDSLTLHHQNYIGSDNYDVNVATSVLSHNNINSNNSDIADATNINIVSTPLPPPPPTTKQNIFNALVQSGKNNPFMQILNQAVSDSTLNVNNLPLEEKTILTNNENTSKTTSSEKVYSLTVGDTAIVLNQKPNSTLELRDNSNELNDFNNHNIDYLLNNVGLSDKAIFEQNYALDIMLKNSNDYHPAFSTLLRGIPNNKAPITSKRIDALEFTSFTSQNNGNHYIDITPTTGDTTIQINVTTSKASLFQKLPNSNDSKLIAFTAESMQPFAKAFSSIENHNIEHFNNDILSGLIPIGVRATDIVPEKMFEEIKAGKSSKPSTTIHLTSAENMASALLYQKGLGTIDNLSNTNSSSSSKPTLPQWRTTRQNKDRFNNRKVIDGVYDSGDDIDNTLRDIIIATALKANLNSYTLLTNDTDKINKALETIKKAKAHGAVSSIDTVTTDPWEKAFSKEFQKECKKCGILSGRGQSSVGLRTAYVPDGVFNKISILVNNTNSSSSSKDSDVIQNAAQNVSNKQQQALSQFQNTI